MLRNEVSRREGRRDVLMTRCRGDEGGSVPLLITLLQGRVLSVVVMIWRVHRATGLTVTILLGGHLGGRGVLFAGDGLPGRTMLKGEKGFSQPGCPLRAWVNPVPVQGQTRSPIGCLKDRSRVDELNTQSLTDGGQVGVGWANQIIEGGAASGRENRRRMETG